ncbi:MAG TPA: S4 domain-containing protein [Methylophilaceae bacterium]
MTEPAKLRLDKWLWAARFFKTRSLASTAIDGGKVHYDGQRAKPAKEIHVGATLRITRGIEVFEVIVRALSEHRKGAPEAALLFEETQESQQRRAEIAAGRRVEFGVRERGEGRPTKRQRRQIRSFFGD